MKRNLRQRYSSSSSCSQTLARAPPVCEMHRSTDLASSSPFRPDNVTLAPSLAKWAAVTRPIPLLAPGRGGDSEVTKGRGYRELGKVGKRCNGGRVIIEVIETFEGRY